MNECRNWEKTIVTWLNCLTTSSPIKRINEVNHYFFKNILKTLKPNFEGTLTEFICTVFQNESNSTISKSSSDDYLWMCTLLLIYVSFSRETEVERVREVMCTKLDYTTQLDIVNFLNTLQEYNDIFNVSFETIKKQIFNLTTENNSSTAISGVSIKTPVKNGTGDNSFGSPLQGFFQTPTKSRNIKQCKSYSGILGNGENPLILIKNLNSQLHEEELEKALLQENLKKQTQKCNDYVMKLKLKIEEINSLKVEWEKESKRNEAELQCLQDKLSKVLEDKCKFKSEKSQLEKYISTLETDLSDTSSKKNKLEHQLKQCLEKCTANELQLKELIELNMQLQSTVECKEKELAELREHHGRLFTGEKTNDASFLNWTLDSTIPQPENVRDILFNEKIEENESLKKTLEELKEEKNNLQSEIEKIKEQLKAKLSDISELQYLNIELSKKVESFEANEKELITIQENLLSANAEISRLMTENSNLLERLNITSNNLKEQEKAFINCKNSKMLLHINYLKLAEDFKTLQSRLPSEDINVSRLTLNPESMFVWNGSKSENDTAKESVQDISCAVEGNDPHIFSNNSSLNSDSLEKITELCQRFEKKQLEWSKYEISMEETCKNLNHEIADLKVKINELEDNQAKTLKEKSKLEDELEKSEERIVEIQTSHAIEMKTLREEFEKKENRIAEVETLLLELKKTHEQLMIENEILKKEALKIRTERNLGFMYEGGDFNKNQTFFLESDRVKQSREQQEPNDSLEEISVCNKTFDIVNLEEKNTINKTILIQKSKTESDSRNSKHSSAWVVSPPSKAHSKVPVKQTGKPQHSHADAWVVPLPLAKSKVAVSKKVSSSHDIAIKQDPVKILSNSKLTKSSSLCSVFESDSYNPLLVESKSSTSSFFSSKDLRCTIEKEEECVKGIRVKKFVSLNVSEKHEQPSENFQFAQEKSQDPSAVSFDQNHGWVDSSKKNFEFEIKVPDLEKKVIEFSKECHRLKFELAESEKKRKKDRETFEKNQEVIRQNIAAKYEAQLDHLKNEMKLLHNTELSKHKAEQSKLNFELTEQNKRYKEHIDELRNQLWDLGEKLLQEQKLKRDLERKYNELRKKWENMVYFKDLDMKNPHGNETYGKELLKDEKFRIEPGRQIPASSFPTMPTEDEEEVFDNRFLEDMKKGICQEESPEDRLLELQYRNSLCLPHLKSSYPGETQFQNPEIFKENDIKLGILQFGQESQSLTDSDHSMTKSLIPENKGKRKEQTSYKKPGPPTPSKYGGRLSLQSGDLRTTPRNVLKELNDQSEQNKGTPNPFKSLLSKNIRHGSWAGKDENTAPVTPRKKNKFFRKPFGARDH